MPEPKRPLKVFLCHAHDDKLKTRELYRYLRKRGIQPWLDAEDLVGGQDWRVEIPKAIKASDAIIICLSKNSINKEGFVQAEITFALEKALEIPRGRIFIIPARFEDCNVPDNLERFHWVDLFEDDGFPRLMKSLKTRAGQLERSTVQVPQPDESSPNLNPSSEEKIESEAALEKVEREMSKKPAREKAEKEATQKARLQAEVQAGQKSAREKIDREVVEKPARSFLRNKRIVIPAAIVLFLCVIFFAVFPVITKSDISSTPVSPGISDLNIPSFSATEDIYVYFNLDQTPSSQKFESRWFLKVNILWTDLYIPVGYLEYIPVNRDTHLLFHLKNPGIAGEYRVDIYMDQNLVGTQIFEIYPKE